MQRVIIERSYERLIICYADGHREEVLDTERITWLLYEAEALVSFFIFTIFINQSYLTISSMVDALISFVLTFYIAKQPLQHNNHYFKPLFF